MCCVQNEISGPMMDDPSSYLSWERNVDFQMLLWLQSTGSLWSQISKKSFIKSVPESLQKKGKKGEKSWENVENNDAIYQVIKLFED